MNDLPPSTPFDAAGARATREERQRLGQRAVLALSSLLRNARSYSWDNDVFAPAIDQLQESILALLSTDGAFELESAGDGFYLNRQAIKLDPVSVPLGASLRSELRQRGLRGIAAALAPPRKDLRLFLRLFHPMAPPLPGPRGDPSQPFASLSLLLAGERPGAEVKADPLTRLAETYGNTAAFVNHTVQQLRVAGELIPLWAASRMMQDLVDLQRAMPLRFLQLAGVKAEEGDRYWGVHAANVAVLAVTFGARLGLSRRRRHDLGMAALFHDVGMAALPASMLLKSGALDAKDRRALKASPLFSARAILRDREVHTAALERALAAHECHLDLVPADGPLPEIGLAGRILSICESFDALTTARPFRPARTPQEAIRIMTTEQLFRFDPHLVDLFVRVVTPLL
jgi:hypothetical protein